MRNLKKFLALVLAMLMIVGAMSTVSAFDDVPAGYKYEEAINDLSVKKIINGYDETTFDPEGSVVRWQMALMIAKAITGKVEYNWKLGYSEFIDVDSQDQFPGAIAYVADQKIITGVGENKFEPKEGITLRDGLIMAVRALKQDAGCAATGANYWVKYYNKAITLGLLTNLEDLDPAAPLTRAQTAQLIFNLINADRADSDLTFAAECFGIADVANTTVFVLTATANQSYVGAAGKVMDAAYVALQPLNADSTIANSVIYVKAADLGLADADAYVGYAIGLINFDAKTEKFTGATVVSDVDTFASTAVTAKDGKVTIDGKAYYLVAAETDSLFKNELVMLKDGTVAGEVTYNYLTDAAGKLLGILGANGKVATFIGYSEGIEYFATADAPDTYVTKENLPAEYKTVGTPVDGYVAMSVNDLGAAYQITVFDDDKDGVYDRAIYAPVYTSIYKDFDKNGVDLTVGPWTGVEADAAKKAHKYIGSDLVKGDLFTYTYNAQTKVINVIEEIAYLEGTVTSANYTDGKFDSITIDGVNYKYATESTEGTMGSKLFATGVKEDSVANVIKNANIVYTPDAAAVGQTVQFYAKNGLIIYIAAKPGPSAAAPVERVANRIVLKNVTNWDSTGFYGDIVFNGTEIKNAKIAAYWHDDADDKKDAYVAYSSLTQAQLMLKLTDIVNAFVVYAAAGNQGIFDGDIVADGYGLRLDQATLALDGSNAADFALTKLLVASDAKLTFANGVMADTGAGRTERLRTNAATKWVFIDADGAVTVKTGLTAGADDSIKLDANTVVLANKIGWTAQNADPAKDTRSGVASEVYVIGYTKANITGFGIVDKPAATVTYPVVYIPHATFKKVSTVPAATLGLTGTANYTAYSGVALKLVDFSTVTTFYLKETETLKAGWIYEIDSKGVLTEKVEAVKADGTIVEGNGYLTAAPIDLVDLNGEYIELWNGETRYAATTGEELKLTSIKAIAHDGSAVITDATKVKEAIEAADLVAYYGKEADVFKKTATSITFIIIEKPVVPETPVDPPVTPEQPKPQLTANASWKTAAGEVRSARRAGNAIFTVGAAIDVDVELYKTAIDVPFTADDKAPTAFENAVITVVDIAKRNNSTGVYASVLPEGAAIEVVGSYSAGDLAIDGIVYSADGDNYALDAGRYNITVAVDVLGGAEVTFNVTIQD